MASDILQTEDDQDSALYEVKLEVFEGPMDLLLYLIRKDELDIYDIPIAHITKHYLGFLEQIHLLDIEQASDFILMAATLMRIKAQMLLPREEGVGEEGDDGDPRAELMRRLLEYQQFKEVADWLGVQKESRSDVFLRRQGLGEHDLDDGSTPGLKPVSLFDLIKVYKHMLDTVPQTLIHQIVEEHVSVEECITHILDALERRSRVRFMDLIKGRDREGFVATFIGILELLKSQRIRVQQAQPFDDIWIEEQGAPDEPLVVRGGEAGQAASLEWEGNRMAFPAEEISPEDESVDRQEAESGAGEEGEV
ncbi:MAG: segregation and condensation protein A [Candidatus Latescibacterota bacterium]|jgi:segregation and condensation protein A